VEENLTGIAAKVTVSDICKDLNDQDDIVQWLVHNDVIHLFPALNNIPPPLSTRAVRGRGDIKLKMDANWTIRDILPARGMVAVFGPPGSGKTFWMLDMAMHIAAGVGYNGHTTKHGPVLYIPLEGGNFDNRVIMWCKGHGLDVENLPIYISDVPLDLLNSYEDREQHPASVNQLIQLGKDIEAKEGQPLRAVITDTLSRAMAGGNENEPQSMTAVIGNADAVWKALNTVFIFVHHTGKDTTRGLRGHSSLHGAVDTMIEIKSLSTTTKSALIAKQRNGEDGMSYGFTLDKVDIGIDSDGEMLTTCTVSHLTAEELSEIKEAGSDLNKKQRFAMEIFDQIDGTKGYPEPGTDRKSVV
jgi:KaiC/GvpD/RAD55 family RecA-like ATPase